MAHVHVEGWLLLVSGGREEGYCRRQFDTKFFKGCKNFPYKNTFGSNTKEKKKNNLNKFWNNKNIKKPKIDGQLSKEKVMNKTFALSTEDTLFPLSQNKPGSLSS